MKLPRLEGTIERRLLVNYRVDADVAAAVLPDPFRPQIVRGSAVAGICLLRLGAMRPRGLPSFTGLASENAAHRFAVEWDTVDGPRTGVYIPRRDTASVTNLLVGGRVYPGEHHRAQFDVTESATDFHVSFAAKDGSTQGDVDVRLADALTGSRLFDDVDQASRFFELGSAGYSATRDPLRFDGLELQTSAWRVEPASVRHVESSFFADRSAFPPGAAELDCALVMRGVPVVWNPLPPMFATTGVASSA